MIYKVIAFLIVAGVIVVPLAIIAWLALSVSWVAWGLVPLHIILLYYFFSFIKSLNESIYLGSGPNDTLGASEKVIAVLDNETKKKRI